MNPVLLKPGSERSSQVVVLGKAVTDVTAMSYRGPEGAAARAGAGLVGRPAPALRRRRLRGRGLPTEINLRDTDIANMGLATAAQLPVVVVGDIDRGGVFPALYGTVALMPPGDQALVAGFLVNKFRGDPRLLAPGLDQLRDLTGRPTLGVLPWVPGLWLDVEDSLDLDGDRGPALPPVGEDVLRVSVVRFPRLSNFTDLDALAAEPGCWCATRPPPPSWPTPTWWCCRAPGPPCRTWGGCASAASTRRSPRRAAEGRPVLGICGGHQMLARTITDDVESRAGAVEGLGPAAHPRGVRPREDPRPADRCVARAPGERLRDPPRRGHPRRRRAVPGRRPGGRGQRHDLARGAGERRVPPRLPRRRRRHHRTPVHRRPRHRLRRRARGPARRPGRPGRRARRHRRAVAADRVRHPARVAAAAPGAGWTS